MHAFFKSFISLLVAIDPLGALPFLVGITRSLTHAERTSLVHRATLAALVIGLIFLFAGRSIFEFLGIRESDFRVAGGVLLVIFAIRDLLVTSSHQGAPMPQTVGIVPIAVPIMMGPAALATLMVGSEQFGLWTMSLSLTLNLLVVWLLFGKAYWIMSKLGESASDAINKIFSLLIAAIGVMLIRSGISEMISAAHQ